MVIGLIQILSILGILLGSRFAFSQSRSDNEVLIKQGLQFVNEGKCEPANSLFATVEKSAGLSFEIRKSYLKEYCFCLFVNQNYVEAEKLGLEFLNNVPNSDEMKMLLANIYLETNQVEKAQRFVDQVKGPEFAADRIYTQGRIYYFQKKYKEAILSFRQLERRWDTAIQALYYKALSLMALNDFRNARVAIKRLLKIGKNSTYGKEALGLLEEIRKKDRRWGVGLSESISYDSNVKQTSDYVLLDAEQGPSPNDPYRYIYGKSADLDDFINTIDGSVSYLVLPGTRPNLNFRVGGATNYFFKNPALGHLHRLYSNIEMSHPFYEHQIRFIGTYQRAWQQQTPIMESISGRPGFIFNLTDYWIMKVEAELSRHLSRFGYTIAPVLGFQYNHERFMAYFDGSWSTTKGEKAVYNYVQGTNQPVLGYGFPFANYTTIMTTLGGMLYLPADIDFNISSTFSQTKFEDEEINSTAIPSDEREARQDHYINFSAGVSKRFNDSGFQVGLNYSYFRNASSGFRGSNLQLGYIKPDYSYIKHTATLMISYQY